MASSGKYKLAWDNDYLYVLAEITDDKLIDIYENGLDRYWNDDCLEIFVDEDRSKGNHQYNHSAFAYHLSLDGKVTDLGPDKEAHYYSHIKYQRLTQGKTSIWECAVEIHPDSYIDGQDSHPLALHEGKVMGFALAYCDNDDNLARENFIGSVAVEGEDKNRGWIDAGIFEAIKLVKK